MVCCCCHAESAFFADTAVTLWDFHSSIPHCHNTLSKSLQHDQRSSGQLRATHSEHTQRTLIKHSPLLQSVPLSPEHHFCNFLSLHLENICPWQIFEWVPYHPALFGLTKLGKKTKQFDWIRMTTFEHCLAFCLYHVTIFHLDSHITIIKYHLNWIIQIKCKQILGREKMKGWYKDILWAA